ncbi:MAG: hypothetical protein HY308_08980 [Gammaproteobacteria bacterium]|nr:hypothetical protein [Gammaproteobacteria bacterium]
MPELLRLPCSLLLAGDEGEGESLGVVTLAVSASLLLPVDRDRTVDNEAKTAKRRGVRQSTNIIIIPPFDSLTTLSMGKTGAWSSHGSVPLRRYLLFGAATKFVVVKNLQGIYRTPCVQRKL